MEYNIEIYHYLPDSVQTDMMEDMSTHLLTLPYVSVVGRFLRHSTCEWK